jgi:hypothetical protein
MVADDTISRGLPTLGEIVPGDKVGRTHAEWIAAAVIQRAMRAIPGLS